MPLLKAKLAAEKAARSVSDLSLKRSEAQLESAEAALQVSRAETLVQKRGRRSAQRDLVKSRQKCRNRSVDTGPTPDVAYVDLAAG